MAVPNIVPIEKWAVADWVEWNSLPESHQVTQQFYVTQKITLHKKK